MKVIFFNEDGKMMESLVCTSEACIGAYMANNPEAKTAVGVDLTLDLQGHLIAEEGVLKEGSYQFVPKTEHVSGIFDLEIVRTQEWLNWPEEERNKVQANIDHINATGLVEGIPFPMPFERVEEGREYTFVPEKTHNPLRYVTRQDLT